MDDWAGIAFRLLQLEEQIDTYQKLHEEEISELQETLRDIRQQMLTLADSATENELGEPRGAWLFRERESS